MSSLRRTPRPLHLSRELAGGQLPSHFSRIANDGLQLLRPQFAQDPRRFLEHPPPEEAAGRVGLVNIAVALQTVQAAAASADVLDRAGQAVGPRVDTVVLPLCAHFLVHARIQVSDERFALLVNEPET